MTNYFNTLSLREKLNQLGVCEFMDKSEFADGVLELKGKKIVAPQDNIAKPPQTQA